MNILGGTFASETSWFRPNIKWPSMMLWGGVVAVLVCCNVQTAYAQSFGIDEFRAGVLFHSIDERGPNGELLNFSRLQDVSFEILFTSPDLDVFRWIGSPRPNVGVTLNSAGLESMVHLALTWDVPIGESNFFVEGSFGAAIHNGAFSGAVFPARNLGCLLQFYEAGGIGMHVTEDINVILEIEHASTAKICLPNKGLTSLGIKVGFKF